MEDTMSGNLEMELTRRGVLFQCTQFPDEVFTAEGVAKALGMKLSQIAKAILVKLSDKSYAVTVLGGDKRLDLASLPKYLDKRKAVLAKRNEIPAVTGLPVGAVTPLVALRRPLISVIMDEGLLQESVINVSSGDLRVGLNLSPAELARVVGAIIGKITE